MLRVGLTGGLATGKSFVGEALAELGCLVVAGSPADFANLIAGEIKKWAKVIRAAGIKPQ